MTDQSTISQLNPILVLADADLLLADQSQGDGTYVTKKITSANVSAKFSADAGAAASGYAEAAAASAATAATSETNAAASATTATTKAGVATTKAGDAASSAAAAATSETNAATSETNAATSETNAAASEAAASASETNAASSETAAATSETNAAASAAIGVSTLRFTAASLAAAKALLSSGVSLQSSATMTLMGRAGFFDGYEGDFVYDGSDSTTTFPNDMYGFVDGADRRWKRKLAGYGSVNWSPVKIDFSEDAAAYIRSAIDQAIANKLSRVNSGAVCS